MESTHPQWLEALAPPDSGDVRARGLHISWADGRWSARFDGATFTLEEGAPAWLQLSRSSEPRRLAWWHLRRQHVPMLHAALRPRTGPRLRLCAVATKERTEELPLVSFEVKRDTRLGMVRELSPDVLDLVLGAAVAHGARLAHHGVTSNVENDAPPSPEWFEDSERLARRRFEKKALLKEAGGALMGLLLAPFVFAAGLVLLGLLSSGWQLAAVIALGCVVVGMGTLLLSDVKMALEWEYFSLGRALAVALMVGLIASYFIARLELVNASVFGELEPMSVEAFVEPGAEQSFVTLDAVRLRNAYDTVPYRGYGQERVTPLVAPDWEEGDPVRVWVYCSQQSVVGVECPPRERVILQVKEVGTANELMPQTYFRDKDTVAETVTFRVLSSPPDFGESSVEERVRAFHLKAPGEPIFVIWEGDVRTQVAAMRSRLVVVFGCVIGGWLLVAFAVLGRRAWGLRAV